MWGNRNSWDPWTWLDQQHPDVQVVVDKLQDRVQGCVDVDKRIIWLDQDLTPVQARCVLAYEIGQLQRGPVPTDPCMAAAHRRDAEDWAARMLVPPGELSEAFAQCYTIPDVADFLGVDVQTVRARLRGLTDDEQDAVMSAIYHLHHRESA